jgi:hypothetical protein
MGVTNGNWSRIGDHQFGFGLKRFSTGGNKLEPSLDEHVLWRLQISTGPGKQDVKVDVDASIKDLVAIRNWCEEAIKTLRSDGGRNPDPALLTVENCTTGPIRNGTPLPRSEPLA